MKYYLSAALTIRTKWFDSLKEWFLWNKFIGVEHFYIVDDNKDKALKDFFKNFSDQITFIDDINTDESIPQRELFRIIYDRHRTESHWIAFIDDDEYIMSLQGLTFVNFLKSIEDKRGVELTSRFFGPHGYHKHEGLKHDKLDLEEFEREAKNFKKVPLIDEDEVEIEVKELSSRLFKEGKITKRFDIPPEIQNSLEKDLEMYPMGRFIKNLKAVNSTIPTYRIFLLNGNFFDIKYQEIRPGEYGLMAKMGIDEYDLYDYKDINYAKKHIDRLMTEPILQKQEDEEDLGDLKLPTKGGGIAGPPGAGGKKEGPALPSTPKKTTPAPMSPSPPPPTPEA